MQITKPQPDMFTITVDAAVKTGQLHVTVNDEETITDCFEFSAPLGAGLLVRRVVRLELVSPDDEPSKPMKAQAY